ncbi:ribosome small subunit-dependent GTPase A [Marinicella rhabdoformis]|uniref:ribosome small subunit-dependent GTPase A n=1 Tax=Marinicella rhabdoformis TaxID=2580566 RepID=UPI0012AECABC|nr:ribosome small subunit-dependent GTPase A [Marinicella rhabdoformis]
MTETYRVTSTQKNTASMIHTENHQAISAFFPRKLKPICGDEVEVEHLKSEFRITRINKRFNSFCRADSRGRKQHIAANVDQIMIVMAVKPEPTRDILNRYLVVAEKEGITPLLVFNKSDMDPLFFVNTINQYEKLGYLTFKTYNQDPSTVVDLKRQLADKTTILAGQSGVGKSSLTELMMPEVKLKTGKLSDKTGKGAHTTSVTQMYHDSTLNANIIDSPGVWEYGLWSMEAHEIAAGFIDFDDFMGQCKFSNCTHIHEPGCAIELAVKQGKIKNNRFESYLRIVDSMKYWA